MGLRIFFLFALFCGIVPATRAWPPEVAPELTYSNGAIDRDWKKQKNSKVTFNRASLRVQKKFRNAVAKKCPECVISEKLDKYGVRKYHVELPSGWYFEITLDPGVIEITTKPIPLDQLDAVKGDMTRLIWGVAEDLKLRPQDLGHLNFGLASTFGDDSLLFHNFLADFFNHPGLTEGVLGPNDYSNAPHPEELSIGQRKELKRLFDGFNPKKHSIRDFARKIFRDVYYKSTVFGGKDGEPHEKFHAANVTSIARKEDPWPRLEMRSIPMQIDFRHFEQLTKLFMARIEFLKKNKGKVVYQPENFREQTVFDNVKDFYFYVRESGLDWADYRQLVSQAPEYQLALEGLDYYIEKGGLDQHPRMVALGGCAASFGGLNAKK